MRAHGVWLQTSMWDLQLIREVTGCRTLGDPWGDLASR
jgi:hypothetical protein